MIELVHNQTFEDIGSKVIKLADFISQKKDSQNDKSKIYSIERAEVINLSGYFKKKNHFRQNPVPDRSYLFEIPGPI